ncbi:MAG: copper resistance protein NlpE N-terminal domain-containing protein [bacterium]
MNGRLWIVLLFTFSLSAGCTQDEATSEDPLVADATTTAEHVMPDAHNSRNSLDWSGTYSGVVPCASCPGIATQITLNADGTFDRTLRYIDKSPTPIADNGRFTWNAAGSKVTLGEGVDAQRYQVGENQLFQLDRNGERMTGDLAGQYILHKHVHDPLIEDQLWRLVELRGQPIESRKAELTLRAEDSVASGNASCNRFTGAYAVKSGQRIEFDGHMAVTRMACPDMSTEAAFLQILQQVDHYAIGQDGNLSLHKARMAPLARFAPEGEPSAG